MGGRISRFDRVDQLADDQQRVAGIVMDILEPSSTMPRWWVVSISTLYPGARTHA